MLKQRVITALIAAPTVIAAIFLLPLTAFAAVFLVLAGLGVLEWANLAGLRSNVAKVVLRRRLRADRICVAERADACGPAVSAVRGRVLGAGRGRRTDVSGERPGC